MEQNSDNIYYVYVYLDPRHPVHVEFGDFVFDFLPYYVGKGKNTRYRHLLHDKTNSLKANTTRKIMRGGFTPIIKKIVTNMTSDDAYLLESSLILQIGTRIKIPGVPPGPLSNAMLTGIGIASVSDQTRKVLSEKATEQWRNQDLRLWKSRQMTEMFKDVTLRLRLSEKMKSVCATPEWNKQKQKSTQALWNDIDYRNRQTEAIKLGCSSEKHRLAQSTRQKENWKSEEYRRKHEGRTHSTESKQKMSDAAKERNQNPEEIERKRKVQKERMKDPDIRKMISEKLKGRVQSDETKEKRRLSMIAYWDKRRQTMSNNVY